MIAALTHISAVLDKHKHIFINNVYAKYDDIVRLITDIRRGANISTVETNTYINILIGG